MKTFNEWLSENATEFHQQMMAKHTVAPIDTDRYTPIPGLEGPFRDRKSGKVVYYDPKVGEYYDRDSDMYLGKEFVLN
jgi:hypothetical protein